MCKRRYRDRELSAEVRQVKGLDKKVTGKTFVREFGELKIAEGHMDL